MSARGSGDDPAYGDYQRSRMVYKWRENRPSPPVDPEVAGQRLEQIRARNGVMRPIDIVDDARPENSPLHPAFEWDDRIAAERHRENQARELVTALIVTVARQEGEDEDDTQQVCVGFVSVVSDDRRGYVPIAEAFTQRGFRQQVIDEALRGLEAWRTRYNGLSELSAVYAAAEEALQKRRRAKQREQNGAEA